MRDGPPTSPQTTASRAFVGADSGVSVALVAALVISGVLVRIGLLSPENLFGLTLHGALFSLHGALSLAALPIVLLALTPATRPDTRLRRLIASGYALGTAIASVARHQEPASAGAITAGAIVMLGALAVHARCLLAPLVRSGRRAVLSLAGAGLALGWVGLLIGAESLAAVQLYPLALSALLLPLIALRERGEPVMGAPAWIAAGIYLVARTVVRYWPAAEPLVLLELPAVLVLTLTALRAAAREETAWQRLLLGTQALLFAAGVTTTALIRVTTVSAFLDDTLIAVGAMHLEALVLVFGLLRVWIPAPRSALALSGLMVSAVGAHVFGYACVQLGRHGMSRGYGGYLEVFSTGQRVTSIGALTLLAGLVLIALGSGRSSADDTTSARAPR